MHFDHRRVRLAVCWSENLRSRQRRRDSLLDRQPVEQCRLRRNHHLRRGPVYSTLAEIADVYTTSVNANRCRCPQRRDFGGYSSAVSFCPWGSGQGTNESGFNGIGQGLAAKRLRHVFPVAARQHAVGSPNSTRIFLSDAYTMVALGLDFVLDDPSQLDETSSVCSWNFCAAGATAAQMAVERAKQNVQAPRGATVVGCNVEADRLNCLGSCGCPCAAAFWKLLCGHMEPKIRIARSSSCESPHVNVAVQRKKPRVKNFGVWAEPCGGCCWAWSVAHSLFKGFGSGFVGWSRFRMSYTPEGSLAVLGWSCPAEAAQGAS